MMQTYLTTAVSQLNAGIASLASSYPSSHPGATVSTYDVFGLFTNVSSNPSMYGFEDTTGPTYQASPLLSPTKPGSSA